MDQFITEQLISGSDVYLWHTEMRKSEANKPIIWPWNSYNIRPYNNYQFQVTAINVAEGFSR